MKIFKLFISLSLILSISLLNSFAAISVSDGSAFVTKAEFAADLNNLSNRMSSLENSLDAKIDSLVSSYLSRNGIWNGEKQEIKINSEQYPNEKRFRAVIGLGADYSTAVASGYTWYANIASRKTVNSSGIYPMKAYGGNKTYTVVEEFNKSGLICVNYRQEYMLGTPYNTSTKQYRPSGGSGKGGVFSRSQEWSYGFSSPFTWTFYEYDKDDKQVGNALSVYSEAFNTTNAQIPQEARIKYTDSFGSWYAFVTKGNKLVVLTSSFGNGCTGSGAVYGIPKGTDDSASGFDKLGLSCMYTINDIIIY